MSANPNGNLMDSSMDDAQFFNGAHMSEDWYHGHKVVAMPSSAFGGLSIREVVSSRNEIMNESNATNNSSNQRPRRSTSLGRQPVRPGRDIIQDVYDRMGVSYSRPINNYESSNANSHPGSSNNGSVYDDVPPPVSSSTLQTQPSFIESDYTANNSTINNYSTPPPSSRSSTSGGGKMKDKFSGRYRAAAAATTRSTPDRPRTRPPDRGRMTEPRGRTAEPDSQESEGRRRARSLSRGLSVRGLWPPPKDNQPSVEDDSPVMQHQPPQSKGIPVGHTSERYSQPVPQQQPQPPPASLHPQIINSPTSERPKSPIKRSHSFDARPQYGGGHRSTVVAGVPNSLMHHQYHNSKMRSPQTTVPSLEATNPSVPDANMRDEKKENDDRSTESPPLEETPSKPKTMPSIKDRISSFGGKSPGTSSSSQRNPRRNTVGGAISGIYMKSAAPPPPKVDIYNQTNRIANDDPTAPSQYLPDDNPNSFDDNNQDGPPMDNTAEDYPTQQPSEPSTAEAKYMRPSQMVMSKKAASSRQSAAGSARSSIASSYLSGIQSSGTTRNPFPAAPMSDISTNSNNQYADDSAIPTSSQLDDEKSEGGKSSLSYGADQDRRSKNSVWRKAAAASYANHVATKGMESSSANAVAAAVPNIPQGNSSANAANSTGLSVETIERMVDERVQIQLREVEARMEGLLRRWMDQMNNKITTRLDAMEASIKESMSDSFPRHEI